MAEVERRPRTVDGRDLATGRFLKGNTAAEGRIGPRYDRDLSKEVKRQLADHGGGGETNARGVVKAMIRQAKNGNVKAAEWLGDGAEGKAVQRLDIDVMRRAEVLAIQYGLDPAEVARLAQEIADADTELLPGTTDIEP